MKFFFLLVFSVLITSCENEPKGEKITGKFLYYEGSAILQQDNNIHAVEIDDTAEKLIQMAKGYQRNDTDMVPVSLSVIKRPKKEGAQTWDTIITIKEILAVMHPEEADQSIIISKPAAKQ